MFYRIENENESNWIEFDLTKLNSIRIGLNKKLIQILIMNYISLNSSSSKFTNNLF